MKKILILSLFAGFISCSHYKSSQTLSSIHICDKNGINETISNKNRLKSFECIDFMQPQPYEKVVRIYKKPTDEKPISIITTYHSNGFIHEMLEAKSTRANGTFKSFFSNGQLHMQAHVIEGLADLSEEAKLTWVFDDEAKVYHENGTCIAEIPYKKGKLEGEAKYYHSNGLIQKIIPYNQDQKEGELKLFNIKGEWIGSEHYHQDQRQGLSSYRDESGISYEETYDEGLLIKGLYYDANHALISSIESGFGFKPTFNQGKLVKKEQYKNGQAEGKVYLYSSLGTLTNEYILKDGQKNGVEVVYYPQTKPNQDPIKKLSIDWVKDEIQGKVITWYSNGNKESEREFSHNKKQGFAFAWYKDGNIMLVEEYEDERLVKGKYFKKAEKTPSSQVLSGNGLAMLFDEEGHFLKKVMYKNGIISEE